MEHTVWTQMSSLTSQIELKPPEQIKPGKWSPLVQAIQDRIGGTKVQQPKSTDEAEKMGSHLYNNLLLVWNL